MIIDELEAELDNIKSGNKKIDNFNNISINNDSNFNNTGINTNRLKQLSVSLNNTSLINHLKKENERLRKLVVTYEFKNAFYNKSLGENGEIQSRIKYKYKSLLNTKLDTELVVKSETKNIEMFIKHTGLNDEFSPNVIGITIKYKNNILTFNQPIGGENFKYTILVDKKNNIKNQHYTLCNITTPGKKAHFTGYVTSAEREISYELNFKDDLEGYEDFETLILAEEIDNGKMVILSDIFSPKGNENKDADKKKTRNALIVIIIILAVVCIGGGIGVYAYLRKLKNRPRGALIAKRTDSNDVDGMENDKLVESMSRSQANE